MNSIRLQIVGGLTCSGRTLTPRGDAALSGDSYRAQGRTSHAWIMVRAVANDFFDVIDKAFRIG
jgi:hypothetical protein